MLLPAAPSHARAPCPGCMRQLQLESPVEKNQQQQLRLFKFNGRNARGDFTSEATPATTGQRFIVMLGNAETGPVARSCLPGLAWSCLAWSTVHSLCGLSSWLIRLMDWFELAAVWRSVFKFQADWSQRVDYNRDATLTSTQAQQLALHGDPATHAAGNSIKSVSAGTTSLTAAKCCQKH